MTHRKVKTETVQDAFKLIVQEPTHVNVGAKVYELIDLLLEDPRKRNVFVVDDNKVLKGMVTLKEILKIIGIHARLKKCSEECLKDYVQSLLNEDVSSIMKCHFVSVSVEHRLTDVVREMEEHQLEDLPVIDAEGKLIGVLNGLEILAIARKMYKKKGS